jgi:hypothetical protein
VTDPKSYAQVCAESRERTAQRRVGCPGGQHYMSRDPDGPEDRPWKCRACDHQQPWTGGLAAFEAHLEWALTAFLEGGQRES